MQEKNPQSIKGTPFIKKLQMQKFHIEFPIREIYPPPYNYNWLFHFEIVMYRGFLVSPN